MKEYWQLILAADICDWETTDRVFEQIVRRYCLIDNYQLPENLQFFNQSMQEIKQSIQSTLQEDWKCPNGAESPCAKTETMFTISELDELVNDALAQAQARQKGADSSIKQIANIIIDFLNSDKTEDIDDGTMMKVTEM